MSSRVEPGSTRKKAYAAVSGVGVALALCAGLLLYRGQKPTYADGLRDIRYGVRIVSDNMERAADKKRDAYLEKAMVMRNKFEPWARQHKDLLNAMLTSDGKNIATLNAVRQAVPENRRDLGLTNRDMFFGSPLDIPPMGFTWNTHKPTPNPNAREAADEKGYGNLMRRDFAKHSDYVLSQSLGPGSAHLFLWSSGRITEVVQQLPRKKGDKLIETEKELVPPYDFLRAPALKQALVFLLMSSSLKGSYAHESCKPVCRSAVSLRLHNPSARHQQV